MDDFLTNEEIDQRLEEYTRLASDLTAIAKTDRHLSIIKVYIDLAYTLGKLRGMEIVMRKQEYMRRKEAERNGKQTV